MTYLLDTNVLSEWRKPEPDRGVAEWLETVPQHELFLSVVTIGEIRRGLTRLRLRNAHRQAVALESWLAATKAVFADRLVPVTTDVAEEWGSYSARSTVPTADGLIAATASVNGWTVVTRNVRDFEPTGVKVLNPFTG